jgi:hypothetical protein
MPVRTGFGLRPVRTSSGSPYNGAAQRCYVASGTANLFVGDPVVLNTGGTITSIGGLPQVSIASAGDTNPIDGVIVAIEPNRGNLAQNYSATGSARTVLVCVDPEMIYEVLDDASGTLANDVVGLNANLVAGSGGSTSTGYSSWALDATTPATTATFQVKILARKNDEYELGLTQSTSQNIIWEVKINNTRLMLPGTAGV